MSRRINGERADLSTQRDVDDLEKHEWSPVSKRLKVEIDIWPD
jgi:hypothetical protein